MPFGQSVHASFHFVIVPMNCPAGQSAHVPPNMPAQLWRHFPGACAHEAHDLHVSCCARSMNLPVGQFLHEVPSPVFLQRIKETVHPHADAFFFSEKNRSHFPRFEQFVVMGLSWKFKSTLLAHPAGFPYCQKIQLDFQNPRGFSRLGIFYLFVVIYQ